MDTSTIKNEVEKNLSKLTTLRDEVKVRLHLVSLEAKQEWSDKLEPRVFEAEQAAKAISEASHNAVADVVGKVEDFLGRMDIASPRAPILGCAGERVFDPEVFVARGERVQLVDIEPVVRRPHAEEERER